MMPTQRGSRLWRTECRVQPTAPADRCGIRPVRATDVAAIAELCAAAFRGVPGGGDQTFFIGKIRRILGGSYGPLIETASLLALDAGSAAATGVILVTAYEPYGAPVVALIATHPARRREGIGRALLQRSFAALAEQGIHHCCANIDVGNAASEAFFSACAFAAERPV